MEVNWKHGKTDTNPNYMSLTSRRIAAVAAEPVLKEGMNNRRVTLETAGTSFASSEISGWDDFPIHPCVSCPSDSSSYRACITISPQNHTEIERSRNKGDININRKSNNKSIVCDGDGYATALNLYVNLDAHPGSERYGLKQHSDMESSSGIGPE